MVLSNTDQGLSSSTADGAGTAARTAQYYLVGGGIASLAAAVFLVRDAQIPGGNIHILEQSGVLGGSLDGAGSPEAGYITRGSRMFEAHFACTFDLLDSIPSLLNPDRTVKDEIDQFNREYAISSKCRLVSGGEKVDVSSFGFSLRDRFDLAKTFLRSEASLGDRTIEECFAPSFFKTNFWFMWATSFAFQKWHSAAEFRRYMWRFMHIFPGFKKLEGTLRIRHNQYEAIILPLVTWLKAQGVAFATDSPVTGLDVARSGGEHTISAIHYKQNGARKRISVAQEDRVFVTLGSMTENSTLGSMTEPPTLKTEKSGGAWHLWESLAEHDAAFGRPGVFCSDVDQSKWQSFTVTSMDSAFLDFMEAFTGNKTGTGSLVTIIDSNWLMSVVPFAQPHFLSQPDDIFVFWGYGLFPDRVGNFVQKKMSECSGEEILQELCCHLNIEDKASAIIGQANCIPCMMPFITSQFMPRSRGDRPPVIPEGATNFALMGQFCEVPDDVVFTVEYSVKSAKMAVNRLLGLGTDVPGVYKGHHDMRIIYGALKALRG